ncbi:glycerophosphodiester phosphodiesterase family protein [Dawidia soli]|uniref:GP-PDE domain-containing protein n=1 Tax=Dawidia soli TaxID=2782352 RepID=A0AAP2DEE4_9BACT|nr:glycerophosphodiester phosphodiesterase family protein [Dawidia soli]MBT1690661.1 hypothetical protein [Dawidia soli]
MSFKKFFWSAIRLVFIAICFLWLGFKGLVVAGVMLVVAAAKDKLAGWVKNIVHWFVALLRGEPYHREEDTPTSRNGMPVPASGSLRQQSIDLCRANQDFIRKGALHWIDNMNWLYPAVQHAANMPGNYSGTFPAVLAQTCDKKQGCIILGRAGAGKTSVLKDYMLYILENDGRFHDEMNDKPMVYLSLASWDQDLSLRTWMARELQTMYGQTTHIANLLARTQDHITPVLDGLDQVPGEFRPSVLRGIYEYGKLDGNRIFVTCRRDEFWELRPTLDDAQAPFDQYFCTLELMPLSPGQIQHAVNEDILPSVLALTRESESLQQFASFPMGLSILAQVIKTLEPDDVKDLQHASGRAPIFAKLWKKYEEVMLQEAYPQKPTAPRTTTALKDAVWHAIRTRTPENIIQLLRAPYSEENTKRWLRRLCPLLKTNFSLENLQPDFLPTKNDRLFYFILSRTACTLALSLSLGFFLSGPAGYLGSGVMAGYSLLLPNLLKGKFPPANAGLPVRGWLYYILCPILSFIPVAATLWLYLGFVTPRLDTDMILAGRFALTEANIGIFMAFFVGSIFALRDLRQTGKNEIRLMALAPKNIYQLLKYGAVGSIMLTLTLLLACYLVLTFSPNSSLGDWARSEHHGMDITLLAIPAGIVFGFPLFGILGWLTPAPPPSHTPDTAPATSTSASSPVTGMAGPRHILRSTLNNGWQAGVFAGLIVIPLFSIFFAYITKGELTSISKGVRAGFGAALLAMLWFGGFDLIQYYALKIVIAARGRGPWDFIYFLEHTSRLRLTSRIGAAHSFIHPTLATYFESASGAEALPRRRGINLWPVVIMVIFHLLLIGLPLCERYLQDSFWRSPYGYRMEGSTTTYLDPLNDSTFVVTDLPEGKSTLQITARGQVKAGEFTGYVSAAGTEAAFLGFSIDNVYDLDTPRTSPFCHCALLVKKQHGYTKWYSFPAETIYSLFNDDRTLRLSVTDGDTLSLVVNDREWHNNTGTFQLRIGIASPLPTQVIAHRAGAALAPENTLAAIETALELGVNIIEIDIRQTLDHHLVVMHDATVDRTTTGKGSIASHTWPEIEAMTIRDTSMGILHVPDLADVLDRMKGSQTKLLIEVKDPSEYAGIGRRLLTLLRAKGMMDHVVVLSFDKEFIATIEQDAPGIQTGLLTPGFWDVLYRDVPNVDYLGINYYGGLLLSDHMLAEYKKTGKKILVWTVDYPGTMQSLLDMQVDGIITNHPDKLKKLIAQ